MRRLVLVVLLFGSPLAAADFPVVYVRTPRTASVAPRMAEVAFPVVVDAAADLVRLDPNGAQTVLYDCDSSCSVTDPSVSLDGQRVYFTVIHNPSSRHINLLPFGGCSIHSVPATGGAASPVVLASAGYTQMLPSGATAPPTAPCHLSPQELPAGRLVFASNLWAQDPIKINLNYPSLQLFVRQASGEIEAIAPMTLGSVLHPILLTDGTLMFSTAENQGARDSRLWGLWTIYPDGRHWGPLVSAFDSAASSGGAMHFQAQLSSGHVVVIDYYNGNNYGFGTAINVPWPRPMPAFHSASERPCLAMNLGSGCFAMPFSPVGASVLTPWTHPTDRPATCYPPGSSCADADRTGKVSHPAAYPGNRMLLAWSKGPVTGNVAPTTPYPDTGIYLTPAAGLTTNPNQLELVINDPAYNEHLARAVVPYASIYGQQPVDLPWLPRETTELPLGSPYGIVGTASVFHRESKPGAGLAAWGGLDPFNTSENDTVDTSTNWWDQGSDTSLYADSDIGGFRIVLLEPTRVGTALNLPFRHFAKERHRVLAGPGPCGDFPVESDGSLKIKVPGDTPFTFQLLSKQCESLTMAQTWHQVRPGEVRVDCGGCHYHSHQPIPWEQSLAAQRPATMPVGLRDITWLNRIADLIVGRAQGTIRGLNLGGLGSDSAYDCIANDRAGECISSNISGGHFWAPPTTLSALASGYRSRRSLLWWEAIGSRRDGHTNADHPSAGNGGDFDYLNELEWSPPLSAQELRDLALWIDIGMPYGGPGWDLDTARPVVHIEEPRPGAYQDVPRLLYGVADADSGVVSITAKASWSVAGRAPGSDLHDLAHPAGEGVWELALDGGACPSGTCAQVLTVTALDQDGNPRTVERRITREPNTGTPMPTPVLPTPTRTRTPTPVLPTPTRTRTPTPVPPTSTRTRTPTPVPPTSTRTRTPTPAPPTPTRTRTPTPALPTPTRTRTPTPAATPSTAATALPLAILDADGDGEALTGAALTDGLLALRYLFGLRGAVLIAASVDTQDCTRCTAVDIEAYLGSVLTQLDVDGDSEIAPLTDGVLILRYLFGFSGDALVAGAVNNSDCTRCDATAIEGYLAGLV